MGCVGVKPGPKVFPKQEGKAEPVVEKKPVKAPNHDPQKKDALPNDKPKEQPPGLVLLAEESELNKKKLQALQQKKDRVKPQQPKQPVKPISKMLGAPPEDQNDKKGSKIEGGKGSEKEGSVKNDPKPEVEEPVPKDSKVDKGRFQPQNPNGSRMRGGEHFIDSSLKNTPKSKEQINQLRKLYDYLSDKQFNQMFGIKEEKKLDAQDTSNVMASKEIKNSKINKEEPPNNVSSKLQSSALKNSQPKKEASEIKNEGKQGQPQKNSKIQEEHSKSKINEEENSKRSKSNISDKLPIQKQSIVDGAGVSVAPISGGYVVGGASQSQGERRSEIRKSPMVQEIDFMPKPNNVSSIQSVTNSAASIQQPKNPSFLRSGPSPIPSPPPTDSKLLSKKIPQISGIYPVRDEWQGQIQGFYNPFIDSINNSKLVNPISRLPGQIPCESIEQVQFMPFSFASSIRGQV